jgi:hypothetical protein
MTKRPTASREGIEAASRTYIRCTNLLREELDAVPPDLGLGPRDSFEQAVTLLRAVLERRDEGSSAQGKELTENDFSFNEVLRLMRLTAIKHAGPKKIRLTREDFIRCVNSVLQEEGGLRTAKRLFPNAKKGRYAWIEGHVQTFLHRHRDVVRRSKKFPDSLRIVVVR